ncbi:MAG: glycosyltransferase [Candidatus Omnitrophota bacterium]
MAEIIFAHASAGAGHQKAAEALYNYFIGHPCAYQLQLLDVLSGVDPFYRFSYTRGYPFLINHALFLWRFGFWLTSLKRFEGAVQNFTLFANRFNTSKFADVVIRHDPEYVVSTHFLTSQVCCDLKKHNRIRSKLITVVTDFDVHPFWVNDSTHLYIVASEFTRERLKTQGIDESKIFVYGIPVDPKFLCAHDKDSLRKKFSLKSDMHTVLVITGSFGLGPLEEITDLLREEAQVLVVCARNRKLYSRLVSKNYPSVKVFGFINNVEELMSVADIIVTKPGGMTIAEVLTMELVPIFISPIPGQETGNISAMAHYGIGSVAKNPHDALRIVREYKNNPEKLRFVKERIQKIKKPFAAMELYNEICKGSSRASGRRAF